MTKRYSPPPGAGNGQWDMGMTFTWTESVHLEGIEIKVCSALAGQRFALQTKERGPIYVSPATDLIEHASPAELETLLSTIRLRFIPVPDFSDYELPLS